MYLILILDPIFQSCLPVPLSIKVGEVKLEQERIAWDYYGPAWIRILNQIGREKDRRRHEF
jgi:hypothetical protein